MKQHTIPCSKCPFRRDIRPGMLGGSSPQTYIGQAILPYWLPCHAHYDPTKEAGEQDPAQCPQCAGAAIYRSNLDLPQPDHILKLPKDGRIFESADQFLSHHARMPIWSATEQLKRTPPETLAQHALAKPGVKFHLINRRTVGDEDDERAALDAATDAATQEDA